MACPGFLGKDSGLYTFLVTNFSKPFRPLVLQILGVEAQPIPGLMKRKSLLKSLNQDCRLSSPFWSPEFGKRRQKSFFPVMIILPKQTNECPVSTALNCLVVRNFWRTKRKRRTCICVLLCFLAVRPFSSI